MEQNKPSLKFYKDVFEFWEREYGVQFSEEEKARIRLKTLPSKRNAIIQNCLVWLKTFLYKIFK